LIEIKDKPVPIECPSTKLSMSKLVGAEGEELDSNEPYVYPEIFVIDNLSNND